MGSSSALFELATVYYACRDVETLLKTFAARLGSELSARAVLVWLESEAAEGLTCRARWIEPGERYDPVAEPVAEGVLAEVREDGETRQFSAKESNPNELTHLQEASRGRVKTALYVALPGAQVVMGVVEVINRRAGEFSAQDAAFVAEASRITAQALQSLLTTEVERQTQFSTLERLTLLYDLSRIFNSTLELGELLPIIAEKIRDILNAQACNIWFVSSEGNDIYFIQQAGQDPTTTENARMPLGEGPLGTAAQQGKALLIEDATQEESLGTRLQAGGEFQINSLMVGPLLKDERAIGVIEVINKLDGTPFSEDDLFLLTSVCDQAAVSLSNANLLESERKVQVLDALLKISQEITSTLDLDHVLTTVVHHAATVVPFDQCVIGYIDRGHFVLGAVSGEAQVPKTREMEELRTMLEWVSEKKEPVSADEYEEGWVTKPEEAAGRVVPFLKERGFSGFYAIPLRDEQGTIGVLALLSGDAEFLTDPQRETASILANQTSVAIRNAQLYQQMPLGSILKPLLERREKLLSIPYARWINIGGRIALAAVILTVVPWRMRISSNATVVPAERRVVAAQVSGVIQRVMVHEGDVVAPGQVLAQLDDGLDRVKLAAAQANLSIARHDLQEAEFRRDLALAGQAQLRAQMNQAEVNLEQVRVDRAKLRAPISGVIVTPKVEEKTGKLLNVGDPFCELVDQSRMAVDMNVPETEIGLVRPEKSAVTIKLNSFPTTTFNGKVERLSAQTITEEGEQFFVVRAVFDNPGGRARDGMAGRAKINAFGGWFQSGWYPVGYVLLRSPFHWAWRKAWVWLP